MKERIKILALISLAGLLFVACASNPNKEEKIKTNLDNKENVGGGETLGTNDKGEMVVQNKIRLATYLHDLQIQVYSLETTIYGDESVGRSGLYGVLRDCKDQARSKKYGGDSKVSPPPAKDIKTAGEDVSIGSMIDKLKPGQIGRDEQKQLVGVTEEYLGDRIKRFEGYKTSYQERKDWFDEEVRKCQTDLKDKQAAYEKADNKSNSSGGNE